MRFFKNYPSLISVEITKGANGSKGYGFITFQRMDDVMRAVSRPHKIFGKLVSIIILSLVQSKDYQIKGRTTS